MNILTLSASVICLKSFVICVYSVNIWQSQVKIKKIIIFQFVLLHE